MPKPTEINEVVWAKKGWKCSGAERVRCVTCNVELVVKLSKPEAGAKPKVVAPDAMGMSRFALLLLNRANIDQRKH